SAFQAIASALSPGKKCTPSISPSVVTTRSQPGGGAIAAQSSLSPNAPAEPAASGAQNSAMISSSLASFSGVIAVELGRRQPPRQLVQYAVDHLRLVLGEERVRDVDVLVDNDAGGNVGPLHQLEHAGAQDRTHDRVDTDEPPAFRKLLVDQRIDVALAADDA